MYLALYLLGLLAALLLSFISSGMETALYRVSRVRMRIRADKGEGRAKAVFRVLGDLDAMVTTILIDNNIAAYVGTYFLTMQLVAWRVPHSELVTTAVITPLFFVFTESLPKQLAYNNADFLATALIRTFSMFRLVLSPMVWILNRTSTALRRLFGSRGEAHLSQSQRTMLLEYLSAGVAENVLSAEQNRMAARIMQLEGINAGDSMVPLRGLVLLPASADRARAAKEMTRRRALLALIVDASGKPDGRAVSMNALVMSAGAPSDPIEAVAAHVERIQANKAIPEVLNLFRTRHARHALVMDRGRIIGLITTRTVLDRIAGRIR